MSYQMCITVEKQRVCFIVPTKGPIWKDPLPPWAQEDSGYGALVNDLSLMSSIKDFADGISDKDVKQAIHSGLHAALSAVQKRSERIGVSVSELHQSQGAKA